MTFNKKIILHKLYETTTSDDNVSNNQKQQIFATT